MKFEWSISEKHIIGTVLCYGDIYVYETRRKLKKKYYTKEALSLITLGQIICKWIF